MLCLRCMSRVGSTSRTLARPTPLVRAAQQSTTIQPSLQRNLSVLSSLPSRPRLPTTIPTAITDDIPGTPSFQPLVQPMLSQTRGGKRDTYKPSHLVRKRRLGFLARLRSRTGRQILKRRSKKRRHALTH